MRSPVRIDPELCIGSTECNRIAAAAFRLDEERGVSVVLDGAAEVDPALLAAAVHECPTQAITLASDAAEQPGEDG